MVWFAQTNTGKVAKFDPLTETFTEYDNLVWKNIEKKVIVSNMAMRLAELAEFDPINTKPPQAFPDWMYYAIENNVEPTK